MEVVELLNGVGVVDKQRGSFSLHSLQKQDRQWEFVPPPGECSLATSAHVVKCGMASDQKSGAQIPFLLTRSSTALGCFAHKLLAYDDKALQLSDCGYFETPDQQHTRENRYSILGGPLVIWSEDLHTVMHLACSSENSDSMTLHTFSIQMFTGSPSDVIENYWAFDWSEDLSGNKVLLFSRIEHTAPNGDQDSMETVAVPASADWLCLLITIVNSDLQVERLKNGILIPEEYGSIATCVTLHRAFAANSLGEIVLQNQFLVGTSYQQVVVFENGSPLHCIALDYIPKKISHLELIDGHLAIASQSQTGKVQAFKITDGGPQECAAWDGVAHLLVGDFASLGQEQLLLLFSNEDLSRFCITDLAQFTINSEDVEESKELGEPCAESLVSALKALEVRKQSGETYLMDLERELEHKSHLLEEGVGFLRTLGSGGVPEQQMLKPDPTLVNLLPGDVGSHVKGDIHGLPCRALSSGLKIEHTWQRLLDQKWMIGIVAENESSQVLQDVGFTVVLDGGREPQECSSHVVWMEEEDAMIETIPPQPKKQKHEHKSAGLPTRCLLPGKQVCVVTEAPLPLLPNSAAKATLLVCLKKLSTCDDQKISKYETFEMGSVVFPANQTTTGKLSCSDECLSLWNGKGNFAAEVFVPELREFQDLACILTARCYIQLEAKSTFTNLLRLPAMLKARLPLPGHLIKVANSEARSGKPGSIPTSEALSGVALHITPDIHSAKFGINYKSTPQLSLLLQTMRSNLPDDVHIGIAGSSCQKALVASLKWCLLEELNLRTELAAEKLQQLGEGSQSDSTRASTMEANLQQLVIKNNTTMVDLMHSSNT